jgi:hypothetical protein
MSFEGMLMEGAVDSAGPHPPATILAHRECSTISVSNWHPSQPEHRNLKRSDRLQAQGCSNVRHYMCACTRLAFPGQLQTSVGQRQSQDSPCATLAVQVALFPQPLPPKLNSMVWDLLPTLQPHTRTAWRSSAQPGGHRL